MQCPNCGGDTTVSETRPAGKHTLRRRRICAVCKQRFTTLEQIAPPQLKVEKRRRGIEAYDRAKLQTCLARVCKHRPVDETVIEDLVERIEAELSRAQVRVVRWGRLVELVLDGLRGIDRVAEQRMAANYVGDDGVMRLEHAERAAGAEPPQLPLFSGEGE